jgi:hypothetical protein
VVALVRLHVRSVLSVKLGDWVVFPLEICHSSDRS